MQTFNEFVDRQQRESKRHLQLLEKALRHGGFKIKNFLNEQDPYIFVHSPSDDLSFEGVRVYQIGKSIAYRIQKEQETHPYGMAYELNLEEMFNDFMSETPKEEEAGKKVIENLALELHKFFKQSADAEDELRTMDLDKPKVILQAGGADNMIYGKGGY